MAYVTHSTSLDDVFFFADEKVDEHLRDSLAVHMPGRIVHHLHVTVSLMVQTFVLIKHA